MSSVKTDRLSLWRVILTLILTLALAPAIPGRAAAGSTAAAWPEIRLEAVSSGLAHPTSLEYAADDSGRLFVVEQAGTIRIIPSGGGSPLSTPFLDIHTRVGCCGEQGLLGLAFLPDYSSRNYFYVDYTNLAGNTVVSRFTVGGDPNQANAASEVILLSVEQPYSNHNGGQLAFGPDGYLYIGLGDGGSGGDPQNRAQDPGQYLGKLLRIDSESPGCVGDPPHSPRNYCLPADNPYLDNPSYVPEIWALGLRNPWRFSFDRASGDLYIADVGQDQVEEVDFQAASSGGGENYGWRILEGDQCYNPASGCVPPTRYVPPVATYLHGQNDANGCSITGGSVYRGSRYPGMAGVYFYADLCQGKIFGLRRSGGGWETQLLLQPGFRISTFGQDRAGNLYVADYDTGAVYRIVSDPDLSFFPYSLYLPWVSR